MTIGAETKSALASVKTAFCFSVFGSSATIEFASGELPSLVAT